MLVFALLFQIDLVFRVRFDGEGLRLSLGYGPFRRLLVPAGRGAPSDEEEDGGKEKAKKAAKKKKEEGEKAAEKPDAAKGHQAGDIRGIAELALDLVKAALPPVGKLLTGFRLEKLRLFIRVGGANAAETAVRYGQVCALVHGGLAALVQILPVKTEEVGIGYDFLHNGFEEEISFELRLKLGRLLGQTFRLLGRAGKVLLKQRKGRPQKPLPPEARA